MVGDEEACVGEKSYVIEKTNLSLHLMPVFGPKLISDIDAKDVADYQKQRQLKKPDGAEGAAPKTVNLEIGTLRAILRCYRVWASTQPDVKMLAVEDEVGRAITPDEEAALLKACAAGRSRSLPVGVTVGLNTGHEDGNVGYRQGVICGLARQHSHTRPFTARSVVKWQQEELLGSLRRAFSWLRPGWSKDIPVLDGSGVPDAARPICEAHDSEIQEEARNQIGWCSPRTQTRQNRNSRRKRNQRI